MVILSADLEGQRMGFTLEYETSCLRVIEKISDMVDNLKDGFPYAFKLVVSANHKNAFIRMIRTLKVKVKGRRTGQVVRNGCPKAPRPAII